MVKSPSDAAPAQPQAPAPAATPASAEAPAAAPKAVDTAAGGTVRLAVLDSSGCRELEGDAAIAELPEALARRGTRLWIDLCGADPGLKTRIGKMLGLHPLLIEDLAERDQRAKLEQVEQLLHAVMFSLGFDDGEIYERELDFVLGERFLLSAHSTWWDPRATRHLRAGVAGVLAKGPGHLLWCLTDEVIDGYFPILDQLGDEIDELEDKVVGQANRALLEEKAVSDDDRLYFRDAYDHLIRLTDELDTYRELASATLEAYLSTVNNNLSLIMKRLTGVTVVVAGIGAIGGIFGMSEAQFALRGDEGPGFWIVTASSLVLAGIAAAVLRRIDWI